MTGATTPVGESATRVAASAPPVAQATTPVAVSRPKGRPPGTPKSAQKPIIELLPVPTPDQVRSARIAAGHTQAQAASAIGIAVWATWAAYEGGRYPMASAAWTMYLLSTGQHPALKIAKRRSSAGS